LYLKIQQPTNATMIKSNISTDQELPSNEKLIKSTILAAVTAGALLVTVVMPAEYGIDPTGIGNLVGLKKMGEIRVSLDKELAAEQAAKAGGNTAAATPQAVTSIPPLASSASQAVTSASPSTGTITPTSNEMQVTLAPNEGAEIKAVMNKGGKLQYAWSTGGGKANFDVHADSKKLGIDYHQYAKGSEASKEGEIEAAFDGSHGWFWRNRTSSPITITLKTKGEYTDIKRVK
jgi:hypothetical protein